MCVCVFVVPLPASQPVSLNAKLSLRRPSSQHKLIKLATVSRSTWRISVFSCKSHVQLVCACVCAVCCVYLCIYICISHFALCLSVCVFLLCLFATSTPSGLTDSLLALSLYMYVRVCVWACVFYCACVCVV